MIDIDFLPSRFHEQHARRRTLVWQMVVLMLFGFAVGAAAIGQFALFADVRRELAEIETRNRDALSTMQRSQVIEHELMQTTDAAELHAYLKHPWPQTQLLSELISPLPKGTILKEVVYSARLSGEGPPAVPLESAESSGPAARQDLRRLRELKDGRVVTVSLAGMAQNTAALHSYVQSLNRSPLVDSAELESLEAAAQTGASFLIRVVVKPGHGQPGGPAHDRESAENRLAGRTGN